MCFLMRPKFSAFFGAFNEFNIKDVDLILKSMKKIFFKEKLKVVINLFHYEITKLKFLEF
jgi:hypothetical protein